MAEPAPASCGDGDGDGGNGNSKWNGVLLELPFGMKFDPTDEELMGYLKNKILGRQDLPDIIPTTDVFGTNADQLPFDSLQHGTGERWFFFTMKPHQNLMTRNGYWSPIMEVDVRVGGRVEGFNKEYIYHCGLQGQSRRTNWCVHEYSINTRLYAGAASDDDIKLKISSLVVCKVFRRGNSNQSKRKKKWRKH